MENKLAHLQMIQAVIGRMANNSFLIKGWGVAIVSALFALAIGKADLTFVCLACFPVVTFWALDGYFLRQERLFRRLYDDVRALDSTSVDFSMDTNAVAVGLHGWLCTYFSPTVLFFHGVVFGVVVIVMITVALAP